MEEEKRSHVVDMMSHAKVTSRHVNKRKEKKSLVGLVTWYIFDSACVFLPSSFPHVRPLVSRGDENYLVRSN